MGKFAIMIGNMGRAKILIIDDDQKLCERLQEYFLQFELDLISTHRPSEGLSKLKTEAVDLIILDGMLPEMDGLDVCRTIREHSSIPIIMLTARGDEIDRIVGLEQGADDYIAKPFSPRELIARIRSTLRREQSRFITNNIPRLLIAGDLILNTANLEVKLENELLSLTGMELDILRIFMESPGAVLSREKIIELIHGQDWTAFDRSLDIAISRLRKKIKDSVPDGQYIKTIRGKGYIFVHEVKCS